MDVVICSYVYMLSSDNPCNGRYQKAVIVCSIVINLFRHITLKSLVHKIQRVDFVIVSPHCRTCQHLYLVMKKKKFFFQYGKFYIFSIFSIVRFITEFTARSLLKKCSLIHVGWHKFVDQLKISVLRLQNSTISHLILHFSDIIWRINSTKFMKPRHF